MSLEPNILKIIIVGKLAYDLEIDSPEDTFYKQSHLKLLPRKLILYIHETLIKTFINKT